MSSIRRQYKDRHNVEACYEIFEYCFRNVDGVINEGSNKLDYSGNDVGYLFGLGAEFCFLENHCFSVEGNYRYLSIDRILADSVSGSWGSGLSQAQEDEEVEIDNRDVHIGISGLQGLVGYSFHF